MKPIFLIQESVYTNSTLYLAMIVAVLVEEHQRRKEPPSFGTKGAAKTERARHAGIGC